MCERERENECWDGRVKDQSRKESEVNKGWIKVVGGVQELFGLKKEKEKGGSHKSRGKFFREGTAQISSSLNNSKQSRGYFKSQSQR